MDEEYLTVAEVAALLKLNEQTVRNWIDGGRLPALRVGRRVRIRRSDLDKLLSAGSTIHTPPDLVARERLTAASAALSAASAAPNDGALVKALAELIDATNALVDVLTSTASK